MITKYNVSVGCGKCFLVKNLAKNESEKGKKVLIIVSHKMIKSNYTDLFGIENIDVVSAASKKDFEKKKFKYYDVIIFDDISSFDNPLEKIKNEMSKEDFDKKKIYMTNSIV